MIARVDPGKPSVFIGGLNWGFNIAANDGEVTTLGHSGLNTAPTAFSSALDKFWNEKH